MEMIKTHANGKTVILITRDRAETQFFGGKPLSLKSPDL